jgi:hypothetical protein
VEVGAGAAAGAAGCAAGVAGCCEDGAGSETFELQPAAPSASANTMMDAHARPLDMCQS